MPIDWGDVPTWVAALGTVGTLFYGLRLLDLERSRVARADGDARRSQASCLSAAIERRTDSVGRMAFPRPYRVVVISNASASPVYDVSALVCDDVGRSYVRLFWSVVRPGEEEKSAGYAPHLPDGDLLVDLWFKDAAGHLWRRDITGALVERYVSTAPPSRFRLGRTRRVLPPAVPGDVPPLTNPPPPKDSPTATPS